MADPTTDDKAFSPMNVVPRHRDQDWDWMPKTGVAPAFPDVPTEIAKAASEAHECASIGARMAAILMARTVLEASAKAKRVTEGNLYAKVDKLREKNLIRPGVADAAHEIRHLGNDMAHGDISEPVSAEDVEDVLSLMDQVLNELFQGPALVAKMRAKRAAPKE